jgi:hypothetical protein
MTDFRPDLRREGSHVLVGRPDPPDRLEQVAFMILGLRPCDVVLLGATPPLRSGLRSEPRASASGFAVHSKSLPAGGPVESKVPGRKVIIVFSNGPDNASMVAPDDVRAVAED